MTPGLQPKSDGARITAERPEPDVVEASGPDNQQSFINPIEDLRISSFPYVPGDSSADSSIGVSSAASIPEIMDSIDGLAVVGEEKVPDFPRFVAIYQQVVNIFNHGAEGAARGGGE